MYRTFPYSSPVSLTSEQTGSSVLYTTFLHGYDASSKMGCWPAMLKGPSEMSIHVEDMLANQNTAAGRNTAWKAGHEGTTVLCKLCEPEVHSQREHR